jgi:hypothetical protein
VKNNQRSETDPIEGPKANPPRRRGRPPLPDDEAKRHPLILRTTKGLMDELAKASKASGRSLTEEIEFRLARSLAEDHGKSELDLRLDKAMGELKGAFLVLAGYSRGAGAVDTGRYLLFDQQVLSRHGLKVETTAVGDAEPKPKSKSRRGQRSGLVPSTEELHDRFDRLDAELGLLRTALEADRTAMKADLAALEADRPAPVIAGLRARLDRIREAIDALLHPPLQTEPEAQ